MSPEQMVREFHEALDLPIGTLTAEKAILWHRLLLEEVRELTDAMLTSDLVEIADAIADITYCAVGLAVATGIPFDRIFTEVHRSNMTKAIPPVVRREDGKIIKGPNFEPPKVREILRCD